jgi:hypothetical protein
LRVQGLVTSLDALDVGDEEVITDDLSVAHRLRYAQSVKRGLLSRRKRPTMEQKRPTITSVNLVHDSHSHTHSQTQPTITSVNLVYDSHSHTHTHTQTQPTITSVNLVHDSHTLTHTRTHTHTHKHNLQLPRSTWYMTPSRPGRRGPRW